MLCLPWRTRRLPTCNDEPPQQPPAQARWDAAVGRLSGAQPVYAFWCSSGTTGAQKRLPASLLAVESNMRVGGVGGLWERVDGVQAGRPGWAGAAAAMNGRPGLPRTAADHATPGGRACMQPLAP